MQSCTRNLLHLGSDGVINQSVNFYLKQATWPIRQNRKQIQVYKTFKNPIRQKRKDKRALKHKD